MQNEAIPIAIGINDSGVLVSGFNKVLCKKEA
jgi:hypothetical protein